MPITTSNHNETTIFFLESAEIYGIDKECFSLNGLRTPTEILSGKGRTASIVCSNALKRYSVLQAVLVLRFRGDDDGERFVIGRLLRTRCSQNPELALQYAPVAPAQHKPRMPRIGRHPVVLVNEKLPHSGGMRKFPIPLAAHNLPKEWKKMLIENRKETCRLLEGTHKNGDYTLHMTRLLFTEEHAMHEDMKRYDMFNVVLKKNSLEVPGLAEKRPSVLRGDIVLISTNERTFEGLVTQVQLTTISLRFPRSFNYVPGTPVHVRFKLRRTRIRQMHQGIHLLSREHVTGLVQSIFPSEIGPPNGSKKQANAVVTCRHLNQEQRACVENIVYPEVTGFPYVIFGPPGTGKTATLTSAVKELLTVFPQKKVLLCTPTNETADLMVERLAEIMPELSIREMYRLMAFSRSDASTSDAAMDFTMYDDASRSFPTPEVDFLRSKRLVVSTLCTSAKLFNMGMRRGHFSLIAVDEVGQAMEPEVLSVLGGLMAPSTQLVLAGDPKQLGPVVHSDLAVRYGLGVSYLDRIGLAKAYARDTAKHPSTCGFDPRVITELVRTYRLPEKLLEVPNTLFYEGEMIACSRVRPLPWSSLPRQDIPLMFTNVAGEEMREGSSPSWFNVEELIQVLVYVKDLVQHHGVLEQDIVVVTPYAKQSQKIRTALKKEGLVPREGGLNRTIPGARTSRHLDFDCAQFTNVSEL
ncbi:hypothetical protein NDN08_003991 [Rhodosorus marinus]|uniref:AAA+ ATPase domain-containing protein n=1 Tax=Rhodosorus marinus TaxID=101924 RepID=A0AAV8UH00_9RHOD|nr:hypothetical protein NDN08_003991 [Rhodosorus marinus]